MKFIILSFLSFSLAACTSNWKAANEQFDDNYGFKYGQKYELVKDVYIDCGKNYIVDYSSDYGLADVAKTYSDSKYITLGAGSRFKTNRVQKRGSYNNGYYYTVFAEVLPSSPYAGLEFTLRDLLIDDYGRSYQYTYIRKVEK